METSQPTDEISHLLEMQHRLQQNLNLVEQRLEVLQGRIGDTAMGQLIILFPSDDESS